MSHKKFLAALAATLYITTPNSANAKERCVKQYVGTRIKIAPKQGLEQYLATAPTKKKQILKAMQEVPVIPFPTAVVGLEGCFGPLEPSHTINWRLEYEFIPQRIIQNLANGQENVKVEESTNNSTFNGYLGTGWGAGAGYQRVNLQLAQKLHPYITGYFGTGVSFLYASANLDTNDLKGNILFKEEKERYHEDIDIRAISLAERGQGMIFTAAIAMYNEKAYDEKGNVEIKIALDFEQLLMQRTITIREVNTSTDTIEGLTSQNNKKGQYLPRSIARQEDKSNTKPNTTRYTQVDTLNIHGFTLQVGFLF